MEVFCEILLMSEGGNQQCCFCFITEQLQATSAQHRLAINNIHQSFQI